MLKTRTIRMVAVYDHGQSFQTRPIAYIPAEDAQWWRDSGAARSCCRGKAIQLEKITLLELRGHSARMDCKVIEGNAAGVPFFQRLVAAYAEHQRSLLAAAVPETA